jgi:uncharacterized protein (TIGR02145 family)
MKKLLLLLLIVSMVGFAQGEQRYADGTATDQDGNTFEWINYGTQDWAIEDAKVVTYRDGTTIPQVTDASKWDNQLSRTNAWCYYNNDPTKRKLYNGYAFTGKHDTDPYTPYKELAPEGWRVPTEADWTVLKNYLIENGYNFDGTTTGNKIAKAMASTTGWNSSTTTGAPGNNQSLNNSSGFNATPGGMRNNDGTFLYKVGAAAVNFWGIRKESVTTGFPFAGHVGLANNYIILSNLGDLDSGYGFSVRFVRDASTASINDYSNAITIYPNPTTSIVTIQGDKEYNIEVYDMAGNKVMALTGNNINMEHLSTATYIVKATDKSNNEELTYKVVKN